MTTPDSSWLEDIAQVCESSASLNTEPVIPGILLMCLLHTVNDRELPNISFVDGATVNKSLLNGRDENDWEKLKYSCGWEKLYKPPSRQ